GAGLEIAPVDVRDEVRPGEVEDVGIAGHVDRMGREALATVITGPEPGAVDERAPGPVQHEDPLRREPPDLRSHVPLRHVTFPLAERDGNASCRGSLGVCSTGRQAAFKALRFQLPTGYPPCPVARWRATVAVAFAAGSLASVAFSAPSPSGAFFLVTCR